MKPSRQPNEDGEAGGGRRGRETIKDLGKKFSKFCNHPSRKLHFWIPIQSSSKATSIVLVRQGRGDAHRMTELSDGEDQGAHLVVASVKPISQQHPPSSPAGSLLSELRVRR